MTVINYLLDEHVDPRLRKALKQLAADIVVWRIGDVNAPTFGTPDPGILVWCADQKFILVTNNRATMPVHLHDHLNSGRHMPGIFILNPNLTLGETADELHLIWVVTVAEDYQDRIWYLPISR